MNNKISIIIASYNRAYCLPDAIESVLEQSGGNWELIIVDDGSSDETKKVISKFLTNERVQYYFQQNSGVSAARNKGVELSSGNHIIFLDSDDRFLPGLFSELNKVDYSSYDIICWQVLKKVDGKLSVWKPTRLEKIYNNITATFLAGSIGYKKEVFIEAGGFDPKMSFGENYELGMRISERKDLKIKILDQQFLSYTVNNEFRESNSYSNKLDSYIHLYQKHKVKYIKDKYSYSQINYFLGFIHEKLNMKEEAKKFYTSSFRINPLNHKAFLKSLYFLFK
ncbi:glycosyltransferase family 2 protein [Christiangramia echinicola]|uniref:glycosyltransferase family 2 protein n=1 Tax=Christiangramia echinicola TaxID=279359 RepID=UPI0003F935E8|nr:glycosyltransferase family 2 protein [Christiangramia echinicola]